MKGWLDKIVKAQDGDFITNTAQLGIDAFQAADPFLQKLPFGIGSLAGIAETSIKGELPNTEDIIGVVPFAPTQLLGDTIGYGRWEGEQLHEMGMRKNKDMTKEDFTKKAKAPVLNKTAIDKTAVHKDRPNLNFRTPSPVVKEKVKYTPTPELNKTEIDKTAVGKKRFAEKEYITRHRFEEGGRFDGLTNKGFNYNGAWGGPAQNGKKVKPLVVTSKDDPRYQAYNDSLSKFNDTRDAVKSALKDFGGKHISYTKINPKDWTASTIPINTITIESNDRKSGLYFYPNYKKPQQPVILQKQQEELYSKDTPQVEKINMHPVGIQSNFNLEARTPVDRPQARIPEYYDIEQIVHGAMGDSSTKSQWYPENGPMQQFAPEPYNTVKYTPHYKNGGWLEQFAEGGEIPVETEVTGEVENPIKGKTPKAPAAPAADVSVGKRYGELLHDFSDPNVKKALNEKAAAIHINSNMSCTAGALNCLTDVVQPALNSPSVRKMTEVNPDKYKIESIDMKGSGDFVKNKSLDAWEIHQQLAGEGQGTNIINPSMNLTFKPGAELPNELDYKSLPVGTILGQGESGGRYTKLEQGERSRHAVTIIGYDKKDGMPLIYDYGEVRRIDDNKEGVDAGMHFTNVTIPKGYENYTRENLQKKHEDYAKTLGYDPAKKTTVNFNSKKPYINQIQEGVNEVKDQIGNDFGIPQTAINKLAGLVPGISYRETKLDNNEGETSWKYALLENKLGNKILKPAYKGAKNIGTAAANLAREGKKEQDYKLEIEAYKKFGNDTINRNKYLNKLKEERGGEKGYENLESSVGAFAIKNLPEYATKKLGITKDDISGPGADENQRLKLGSKAALTHLAEDFAKLKKKYPKLTDDQLVDLSVVAYNNQGKANDPEFVDYYIKNKKMPDSYLSEVKGYKTKKHGGIIAQDGEVLPIEKREKVAFSPQGLGDFGVRKFGDLSGGIGVGVLPNERYLRADASYNKGNFSVGGDYRRDAMGNTYSGEASYRTPQGGVNVSYENNPFTGGMFHYGLTGNQGNFGGGVGVDKSLYGVTPSANLRYNNRGFRANVDYRGIENPNIRTNVGYNKNGLDLSLGYEYNRERGSNTNIGARYSFASGGSMPGAVGFSYARTGEIPYNGPGGKKTVASAKNGDKIKDEREKLKPIKENTQTVTPRQQKGKELRIKDLLNEQKETEELHSTGTIKNPKSIRYTQAKKEQPMLRQDTRTMQEIARDAEAMRNVNEGQLYGERPLLYAANPGKLLGDLGIGDFEGTEADRQRIMLNRYNPNQHPSERFSKHLNMGMEQVPAASLSLGLAAFGLPEGGSVSGNLGRMAIETLNPLPVDMNFRKVDITNFLRSLKKEPKGELAGDAEQKIVHQLYGDEDIDNLNDQNIVNSLFPNSATITPTVIDPNAKHIPGPLDRFDYGDLEDLKNLHREDFEKEFNLTSGQYSEKDLGIYAKMREVNKTRIRQAQGTLSPNMFGAHDAFIQKHDITKEYTPLEELLADAYTKGYDSDINEATRRGGNNPMYSAISDRLEDLVKKNKLKVAQELHRGESDFLLENVWRGGEKLDPRTVKFSELQAGDEWMPNSFVSTSIDPGTANSFGNIRSVFDAPAGQSVLYPNATGVRNFVGEMEAVLPKNLRFKVDEAIDPNSWAKAPNFKSVDEIPEGWSDGHYIKKGGKLDYVDPGMGEFDQNYAEYALKLLGPEVGASKSAPKYNFRHSITNPYVTMPLIMGAGALSTQMRGEEPTKFQRGGVIRDNRGYWNPDNWGKPVEIDGTDITMEGVNQPLLGISNTGDRKIMRPGGKYKYRGDSVTEYPLAKDGNQLVKLDQLTNFTNYNTPQPGGWLDNY